MEPTKMTNVEITNPKTGEIQQAKQFSGKLIAIADRALENVNGTEYHPATIEFIKEDGQLQRVSAIMYGNNYKYGVTVGNYYLCTAINTGNGNVLVQVNHLEGTAPRANADMFGFSEVKKEETSNLPA